jgi:hypothetical protein
MHIEQTHLAIKSFIRNGDLIRSITSDYLTVDNKMTVVVDSLSFSTLKSHYDDSLLENKNLP